MGSFKVLMWKHYTVRKRRMIQTVVEFLAPSSMIMALFLLKGPMLRKHEGLLRETPLVIFIQDVALNKRELKIGLQIHQLLVTIWLMVFERALEERFSMDSVEIPLRILYSPITPATRKLMGKVAEMLGMTVSRQSSTKNSTVFYGILTPDKTKDDSNDDASLNNSTYEIVIKLNNMEGDKLPDRLNYTLRPLSFDARRTNPEKIRTFEAFDILRKLFIRLQWAIDMSFIQLKSDSLHNIQNLTMQTLYQYPTRRAVNLKYVNNIFYLLPYVTFLSPLLPFILLMTRLLEERSSGIQELVKMVGVTPAMLAWTQYINTLPSCLIFSIATTVLLKASDTPMVPSSSAVIIFMGCFLHFNTLIALAYACSYIVRNASYTVSLAMFVYIGAWIPIRMFEPDGRSDFALLLLGFLPHCPSYWFLNEMHMTEIYYRQIGITFNNWANQHGVYKNNGTNGSVMFSVIMQVVQIVLLYTVMWYMERVRPGRYGIALPWNFPCMKDYWRKSKNIPERADDTGTAYDPAYQKFFEEPPKNMYAGIQISHISKIFGSGDKQFQALNNVSFEVYKGEITVLVGHNGAGKTTIMSIITGMINPTSGKIYVNGLDTMTQQAQIRRQLGLCPQHNLFFPDLTVLEHFLFFSMIKGGNLQEAKKSSMVLLEQLDLTEKAHKKTAELSGGMLRRLQLGCALCGNASVLILDEPTSGLDVEARREIWDMLLALRGDRTLLLSTHFMEEADVLGDRLAALHGGRLRCHATPMFLKRAVGSGFRLKMTTAGQPDEQRITQAIKEHVPNASLREKSISSLMYELPAGSNLPSLFNSIEQQKADLNIESLGVGITTLEEVFLELCCDVDTTAKQEEETRGPAHYEYVTGRRHTLQQTKALFIRQLDYTKSKLTAYIILQVIMPFVMCTALTALFNNQYVDVSVQLNLHTYHGLAEPRAAYRITGYDAPKEALDSIKALYPGYQIKSVDEFPNTSCYCGYPNSKKEEYLVGLDINDKQARVLYDPTLKYTASVGINLLTNLIAAHKLHDPTGRVITTKILSDDPFQESEYHVPKAKTNCALFAIFNIFILMATSVNDVILPCKERTSVARHTHEMAGCPPVLYWVTTFIYHMIGFLLFCCPASLAAAAFFDDDKTIDDGQTLSAFAVQLVLAGMDFYVFAYFISFYFNDRSATMLLIGLTIMFGFLIPMLMMGLDDVRSTSGEPGFNKVMNVLGIVLPSHMITQAAIRMTMTSRLNSFCKHNIDKCPNLFNIGDGFDLKKCCGEGTRDYGPFNHFAFNRHAMGVPLVLMVVQFFVFGTLVLLLEYGYCDRWWNRIQKMRKQLQYPEKRYHCPHVAAEKEYVAATTQLPKEQIQDTLLLKNCWKNYYKLYGKPTFALRDVNFSVKKGECFGILGVNGAGKTTTFKVLSYEQSATEGQCCINGNFLHSDPSTYMRSLGYCPQFFGLDDFRTGANNLRMLLILRGLTDEDVERETAAWLDVSGMSQHAGRVVGGYSGGMVRRLAAAAALCSGSPLTLLDEPTAGVDTAARRLMWAALKKGLLHDRAIVFTSHNMDEMEMLCKRVTILTAGEMTVLGTPLALIEQYAAGHGILIKLRADEVQSGMGQERVQELKDRLQDTFNCTLKDEHLTSLHFRINERLQYSEIFTKMQAVEQEFTDLVEDYSVADSTLEDVFLTFVNEADGRNRK